MAYRIESFDPTRLYVATEAAQVDEPRACLGFYAIIAHSIGVADVPSDAAPRAPRSNLIPGVFLSHLAVEWRQQGKGLGRILLVDAMQQCQRAVKASEAQMLPAPARDRGFHVLEVPLKWAPALPRRGAKSITKGARRPTKNLLTDLLTSKPEGT